MPVQAFFGPPIPKCVPRGLHLGIALVSVGKEGLWLLFRRKGIFGGPADSWYFPTDYFNYGERIEDCVRRVVREQAGLKARFRRVFHAWSFVPGPRSDWHFGIVAVAEATGRPRPGPGVDKVRSFKPDELPNIAFFMKRQIKQIARMFPAPFGLANSK